MPAVALVIYVVMGVICAMYGGSVKINDIPIENPLMRGFFGPIVVILLGLVFLVVGTIMASPVLLLFVH